MGVISGARGDCKGSMKFNKSNNMETMFSYLACNECDGNIFSTHGTALTCTRIESGKQRRKSQGDCGACFKPCKNGDAVVFGSPHIKNGRARAVHYDCMMPPPAVFRGKLTL